MKIHIELPSDFTWDSVATQWALSIGAALCAAALLTAYVGVLKQGVARGAQWQSASNNTSSTTSTSPRVASAQK
jgi:hypothetical protein